MRKERFPTLSKSKLQPSGDRPFQVLKRINDNAFKLDLLRNYGNVSAIFNVVVGFFMMIMLCNSIRKCTGLQVI